MVRVGAERNAHTLFAGDFQKTDPQVLPIHVAVDLNRFVEPRGFREDRAPIRLQPLATVPHARLRMTEDLNPRIAQAGQVAARLILFPTQRGMEAAQTAAINDAADALRPTSRRVTPGTARFHMTVYRVISPWRLYEGSPPSWEGGWEAGCLPPEPLGKFF